MPPTLPASQDVAERGLGELKPFRLPPRASTEGADGAPGRFCLGEKATLRFPGGTQPET